MAEAAGDCHRALVLIEADVMSRPVTEAFWHPERVLRLIQLAAYGSVLPGWATSRWVLAQAVRWMDASQRRRFSQAFDRTVHIAGGPERFAGRAKSEEELPLADRSGMGIRLPGRGVDDDPIPLGQENDDRPDQLQGQQPAKEEAPPAGPN